MGGLIWTIRYCPDCKNNTTHCVTIKKESPLLKNNPESGLLTPTEIYVRDPNSKDLLWECWACKTRKGSIGKQLMKNLSNNKNISNSRKPACSPDSVVQDNTVIDKFIPPYEGWNYVEILNHPDDPMNYSLELSGKWLLFIPTEDFIKVFRQIARLTRDLKLTHSFKASGVPSNGKEHVFCIYCNYKRIPFVKKIANVLLAEGLLDKYGYKYRDGTKAIYFKTDETTHYKSNAKGESLTLYRFTDKKEFSVKEFNNGKPNWKIIVDENDDSITESFENHLADLEIGDITEDQ